MKSPEAEAIRARADEMTREADEMTRETVRLTETARRLRTWAERADDGLTPIDGNVAEAYTIATLAGIRPTMFVSRLFGLGRAAAAKRVQRLRERGYLPLTTRGKSRGGLM